MNAHYLQRLLDRAAPPPDAQAAPAGLSRSPVMQADQRLNEPGFADLFSFVPPPVSAEPDASAEYPAPSQPLSQARPLPAPRVSTPVAPALPPAPAGVAAPPTAPPIARATAPALEAEAAPVVAAKPPPFEPIGTVREHELVIPPAPSADLASARGSDQQASPPISSLGSEHPTQIEAAAAPATLAPALAQPLPDPILASPPRPQPDQAPTAIAPGAVPAILPGSEAEQDREPRLAAPLPLSPAPLPAIEPDPPPPNEQRDAPSVTTIREIVREQAAPAPAPTRPRSPTAAESSLIGPLAAEPRARTLFGLRRR